MTPFAPLGNKTNYSIKIREDCHVAIVSSTKINQEIVLRVKREAMADFLK